MILIADSGSTKCDWIFTNGGSTRQSFFTMGFNPFFHTSDLIETEIKKNTALFAIAPKVEQVFFYGAGASDPKRNAVVSKALNSVFSKSKVVVDHDLNGAVHATCGDNPGISCILGTGSNSCYFDGTNIFEEVPALGYILGDEASGTFYGKDLLRMFLYHELPEKINKGLIERYGLTKESIFDSIYNKPNPNVYLASFMPFLSDHRDEKWVRDFMYNGFSKFINIHICKYENHKEVPVHFVGSVAFHFSDLLKEACKIHRIQVGIITREPIVNLVDYHLKKLQLLA